MGKPEQPTLFQFEDVLSESGLERLWVDALELGRHPANVPYGDLTAEDVIEGVVREHGLCKPEQASPLGALVVEVADGYAAYERQQFERQFQRGIK